MQLLHSEKVCMIIMSGEKPLILFILGKWAGERKVDKMTLLPNFGIIPQPIFMASRREYKTIFLQQHPTSCMHKYT